MKKVFNHKYISIQHISSIANILQTLNKYHRNITELTNNNRTKEDSQLQSAGISLPKLMLHMRHQ